MSSSANTVSSQSPQYSRPSIVIWPNNYHSGNQQCSQYHTRWTDWGNLNKSLLDNVMLYRAFLLNLHLLITEANSSCLADKMMCSFSSSDLHVYRECLGVCRCVLKKYVWCYILFWRKCQLQLEMILPEILPSRSSAWKIFSLGELFIFRNIMNWNSNKQNSSPHFSIDSVYFGMCLCSTDTEGDTPPD